MNKLKRKISTSANIISMLAFTAFALVFISIYLGPA